MTSAISSALSGIVAAMTMLDVSANNTANISTDGFKADVASMSEGDLGGVVVNLSKSTNPGYYYPDAAGALVEASNVDAAREAVNQIISKHMLAMNIASLKTANEMNKSVLDILA